MLLFAIVLGLAALATSISRPREERRRAPEPTTTTTERPQPTASPGPESNATRPVSFSPGGKPLTKRLRAGRPAVVTVGVEEPGQVQIENLGLTAAAQPLTPARFDVLVREPGRFRVSFTPAGERESRRVGTFAVIP